MSIRLTQGVLVLLQDAGVVDSLNPNVAQPAWVGSEGLKPDPDRLIAALISGGRDPHPSLDIDWPSIQILVRGRINDYAATYQKAWDVKKALLGLSNVTTGLNGDVWASVRMLGDISSAGIDESGRDLFSLNFEIIVHTDDLGNRSVIT